MTEAALGWSGLNGGSLAAELLNLSYSRSDEAAADAFAAAMLKAAGLTDRAGSSPRCRG